MTRVAAAVLMVASALAMNGAQAQEGVKRTDLQQHDLSIAGREAIQVRVDIAPGVLAPRHTHFGEKIIYVLGGTLLYEVEGKPPVTLKAGDVVFIPYGTVHSAKNIGNVNAAELERATNALLALAGQRLLFAGLDGPCGPCQWESLFATPSSATLATMSAARPLAWSAVCRMTASACCCHRSRCPLMSLQPAHPLALAGLPRASSSQPRSRS